MPDSAATRDQQSRLRWLPGSARGFDLPVGTQFESPNEAGYYIDFRSKAAALEMNPEIWHRIGSEFVWSALVQWALGCYERYVAGDGEQWLTAATKAGARLLETQQPEGRFAGGWIHSFALKHSYTLRPPWLNAMAQGEAASLLVRLYAETGEDRYAEAARAAMEPMLRSTAEGGVCAELDGGIVLEEYPTDPPSYVLNGTIFALWGCHDVGTELGDEVARGLFADGLDTLERIIDRYDLGYWSRYDLFPYGVPVANLASAAYHDLHVAQLSALAVIAKRPKFSQLAHRFEQYSTSYRNAFRALAGKTAFRGLVPRTPTFSRAAPWATSVRRPAAPVALSYHAVSPDWPAALSVTPERFEEQVATLARRGYHALTFSEAITGDAPAQSVAITFDDAYRSVLELAAPILRQYGMTATIFAPTSFVGTGAPMSWPGVDHWLETEHTPELVPLSWDELRELQEVGWEIGSHTRTHPYLTKLHDDDLERELAGSRAEIEEKLGACRSLAYPYGDLDDRVVACARRCGYEAAATLPARPFRSDDPLRSLRVGIYRGDDQRRFNIKVSRTVRRVRSRVGR